MWALKQLNLNWDDVINMRLGQLNKMDEFCLNSYERADLYKERMKKYHDRRIIQRNFQKGDLVLFFNSRLKLFPGTAGIEEIIGFKLCEKINYIKGGKSIDDVHISECSIRFHLEIGKEGM
ncbi:hypothetical protein CQW23_12622 [Capsicum baccatum]|uniref:Uncharacterized protein n=1 Tax=Capsicum baccatum TaxID=33114 RepID=A0A2G2WT52_CAPBA|nr:hypothetical protein CQW23_12622 [Capsicum baccatum]